MKQESGRSLIEIIGVLAIGTIISVAAVKMYGQIRASQTRSLVSTELEQLAKNVKLLAGPRNSYAGVSVEYLVKAGALKSDKAPIGDDDWSVAPSFDEKSFSINLTGLSSGECEYFAVKKQAWATTVLINGYEVRDTSGCFSTNTNQVSFIVE
ncbi:MAG: hypothetical protein J6W40_01885 [Alphaproteobacteria bacterium]|nr:hypothetical protein [Alphaproteobacteria bacterium]